MVLFVLIAILAVLAYLYGQKRRAAQRLREAVNLTVDEARQNIGALAAGREIGRDRFDAARSAGAFETAPIHLIATLHQAYDRPDAERFQTAVSQLEEYREFRGWTA
ncbi:hypothetical protein [Maricaulis sp.]|jgi:predicted negative regulator of RcsB-dependent stress response|uniref:hypothetical protein n=1 Tax=Maricaulis sp. TaxID=1486257 RepID=UPI002613A121|nr:hypothetical protein [Maricaulis sp.]